MKIINLFLIIIILYLVYKIFTPLDNFDGTISVIDTNITANKNIFMNYKQNNLEQINDYKKLDLNKSNLIVNNVDSDTIKINNNLCIGDFCLNSSKLKTIAGKIDAPQFYKTVKDKYGDKVKEKIYYNHDCSLKNTDSEFNKCEITNQENLPDEMCFHYIDKELIYQSHEPMNSVNNININFNINFNNKRIYLELNDFETGSVTYTINGRNKNVSLEQTFDIKSNIKEYEGDTLFDTIISIDVEGEPTQPINLYIHKDKKTCINSKHFEILNGRRGLKLKHNTSNIPKILEKVRLKQIEFMKDNKFPKDDENIYVEDGENFKMPPTSDNLDGKVFPTEEEAKTQEIIFKSNYPNFVSDWYIYQTKDSGKLGKRDNTCKGGGKSTRFLPALPGKISGQCCADFLNDYSTDETFLNEKDHDKKCLATYEVQWAEDYNSFNNSTTGAEEFKKMTRKQRRGEPNSSLCKSDYIKDSKWRLPPIKNNFKGACCKDAYPGHTNKECTDKFKKDYPKYDTKKTNVKIDRGAYGKFNLKCPTLLDGTTRWILPDGYCCNDDDSNGRYHGINTKRDCIVKYHNNYADSEYLEAQPDTNDDKYMMPYYLDFRQIGSGIEGTKDQLLFKNDSECTHSNSLYKLNPKFDPRKYPLYKTRVEELNCKDFESNPDKCWKNSSKPPNMNTYSDTYEASLEARLCPHTCKDALKWTFDKDRNIYKCKSDEDTHCIFGINPNNQREPMRNVGAESGEESVEELDSEHNYNYMSGEKILGLRYNNGWLRECPNNNSNKSQVDDGKCIPKGTGNYTPTDLFNATLELSENLINGDISEDDIEDYIDKKNKGKNLHNVCKSGFAETNDECKKDSNMKKYKCKKRWFKKDGTSFTYNDTIDSNSDWISYDDVGKYCLKYQSKEINKNGTPENVIKKKDRGVDGKFKIYCPRLQANDDGDFSPNGDAFKQKWGFDTVPKSADPNIIWSTGCCASTKKDKKFTGSRSDCIKEYYRALREDETSQNNNHGYYMLPKNEKIDQSYNGYYIDMNNNNVKYVLKDNSIAKASSVLNDIQNHRASDNGLCGIDKFNGANAKYFCNSKNSNNGSYDNLCNPITNLEKEINEYAGLQEKEPEEDEVVATNCDNIKKDNPDYDNICISDNRCLKSNYNGIYQTKDNNCSSKTVDYTPFSCKKKQGERNYRCRATDKAETKPPTEASLTYGEKLIYKTQLNIESIDSPLDKKITNDERKNMGELNYIMTPAKDINGNNLSSESYYHGHSHIHP